VNYFITIQETSPGRLEFMYNAVTTLSWRMTCEGAACL